MKQLIAKKYLRVDRVAFTTHPVNWKYFIPNIIGWFFGKIRMRLTAGGAQVAMNSSSELKSSLYL
jgi:hypothetical protein